MEMEIEELEAKKSYRMFPLATLSSHFLSHFNCYFLPLSLNGLIQHASASERPDLYHGVRIPRHPPTLFSIVFSTLIVLIARI